MNYTELISEKKEVIRNFCLPWDESIEHKFAEQITKYPNGDVDTILNRICHDYMRSCFKNEAESAYKFIKQNHPHEDCLYKYVIIREVGKENFTNMVEASLIKLRNGTIYSI